MRQMAPLVWASQEERCSGWWTQCTAGSWVTGWLSAWGTTYTRWIKAPFQTRPGQEEAVARFRLSSLTTNLKSVLSLCCRLLQGWDLGQHWAGTAGERGEAGVGTKSRVLETTWAQREQEERKDRSSDSRWPAATHHSGQIPSLWESPAQRRFLFVKASFMS